MNFKSTYFTSCFFASSMASLGVMFPPQTFLYATGAFVGTAHALK
jgi:hypothetical protein